MTAKELKASILQLAVTGKLVPQDPTDEPASVLLERIKAEKAKLVKAGKIKQDKNPSEIVTGSDGAVYEKFKDGTIKDISGELPFEIPDGWAWARWKDISLSVQYGYSAPARPTGRIKMVRITDIQDNRIIWDSVPYCQIDEVSIDKYLLTAGDILFARTGGTVGKSHLVTSIPEAAVYAGYLVRTRCSDSILPQYAKVFLESDFYWQQLRAGIVSTAQPNFNGEKLSSMLLPLPPFTEQKRIVTKIEMLMPLVEEYGKMEEVRLQLDADLPAMLEKSILQEAIQGKLVPQDPNDEPAGELLKRIAAERKALVKAGKLKRDKTESVIFRGSDRLAYETRNGETVCIQDEIPFEIPDSWEWVRLGDMSNYGQCKSVDTTDIAPDTWSLDLEEIEKGTGRLIERKTAADKKSKSSKHVFTKGTLLYSKLRTYLNKVLVADMDGVCTSEIVPIELNSGVNAEYVRLVLMSPYFLEYTASKGYGIKMPRVGTDDMKQSLIPLPPLDEQKRIVKRVEELKGTARTLVAL